MRNLDVVEGLEPERYELREKPSYHFDVDRRSFLGVAGAGLLIVTSEKVAFGQRRRGGRGADIAVSSRLHIGEDGLITVLTSKVEVGQGSRTQLTQAAAEELRVPLERIRLIMADSAVVPDDGGTAGSRTTPSSVPAVRKAAATAREILVAMAGRRLGVEDASLEVHDGTIIDRTTKRSVAYAELAQSPELAKAFDRVVRQDVTLTPVSKWQVLGSPVKHIDGRRIVIGAHRYPSDVVRPNMLYGKMLRPVSYGAALTSIDLAPAQEMKEVVVVREGAFVGCAAPTSRRARQAVEAIGETAKWERPPHPSSDQLYSYLKEKAVAEGEGRRGPRERTKGSVEQGLAAAKKRLSASYEIAYVQHAPMEPRAAVAEWDGGRLTVWTGTQQPSRVQRQLAEAFTLPTEQVRVIVPDTGGGFGGKHTGETAVEAARLAKAARRPVCLQWTREEEFTWAYFRPAGLIEIQAGLDDSGAVVAWDFANYNSGASAIETPYEVPNVRTRFLYCDSPLREGSYRALASTANAFARESFMDELADAAGADPLEYRLSHLKHPRLRPVLEAAAKHFRWTERKGSRKPNRGIGLACGTEKGSYVATCAEVEVDRASGGINVIEMVQAYECGGIQNPHNLRSQVEGCIIMGLGGALSEEIRFEDGRILNPRFSQYQAPRFKDVPRIELVLLNRPDLPSVGAGETPIIGVAPAIGNAVFNATGVRLRSMPLRGKELKKA